MKIFILFILPAGWIFLFSVFSCSFTDNYNRIILKLPERIPVIRYFPAMLFLIIGIYGGTAERGLSAPSGLERRAAVKVKVFVHIFQKNSLLLPARRRYSAHTLTRSG
jgi:hypothetical protein